MQPERFNRLRKLFESALKLSGDARGRFFDEQCGEDMSLRRELEELIAVAEMTMGGNELLADQRIDRQRAGLEERLNGGPPATITHSPGGSPVAPGNRKIPERIGSFEILNVIGQGGMGTVYEAEQDSPKRVVALKIIRAGLASAGMLRRFALESQVLGRLQHPGIAQIYQAGTADMDGEILPYFAMEYVRGVDLHRYAKEQELSARNQLELLARICDAVHHAHQKGVIHRDLKPSNILVDESGQPKILDFGVARATDSDVQVTTLQTDVGQLIGTIQYMSPEQVAADPNEIETRSDVYALGVIAYELLTGRPPYSLKDKMIHEAARIIREEEPTPASSLNRTLRGDIETIVAKALAKEKDRRYPSAAGLAEDIRRYLDNEPILARPPSAMYQLQKFAKRNKALAGGLAVAMIALVIGMGTSTYLYLDAESARENEARHRKDAEVSEAKAVAKAEEADEVVNFLAAAMASADPEKGGKEISVREVMDQAAVRIAEQFADKPVIEARLRQTIGWTYRGLGLYEIASEHLAKAAATFARELGAEHERTLAAMSSHAVVIGDMGDFDSADAAIRDILEIQRRVFGEGDRRTLLTTNNLAGSLIQQGRYDEAEPLISQLYQLQRTHLGEEHSDTWKTLNNLATCLLEQGRYDDAAKQYKESLTIKRRVLGHDHPRTLETLHNLAIAYMESADYREAEALLREALEIRTRVLGEEHPHTLDVRTNLANTLYYKGRYREAGEFYQQTLEIRRRVLGDEHPHTLVSMNNLAISLSKQGLHEEAVALIERTLEIRRRVLGAKHPHTLAAMRQLANSIRGQERYAEAEVIYRETLDLEVQVLGKDHPLTVNSMGNLAGILIELDRQTEAESMARQCLAAQRRVRGEDHPNVFKSMEVLADSLHHQKRFPEAETLRRQILEMRRGVLGNEHPDTLEAMGNLAVSLNAQGHWAESEALLTERLETQLRIHGTGNPTTTTCFNDVIGFYESRDAVEPGKGYIAKAAEWRAKMAATSSDADPE